MAKTVVAKWSKDLSEMESDATERWENNLNALRDAFDSFGAKFKGEVSKMEGDTLGLKKAFEDFVKDVNKRAKAMEKEVEAMGKEVEQLFSYIWGTWADKEVWEKRFGR